MSIEYLIFVDDKISETPCNLCNGTVIEFSIDNIVWNTVIREDGSEHDKEYLCVWCVLADMIDYNRNNIKKLEANN